MFSAQIQNFCAVHLLQKHRLCTWRAGIQRGLQYLPIGVDCSRHITNVVTQIQAIKRRNADAASAGGTQRVNVRWRGPIRAQPIGMEGSFHSRSVRRGMGSVAHWQPAKSR